MTNLDKNLFILMPKLNEIDKVRITRWIHFAEGNDYTTLYHLIDEGLSFYSRGFILKAFQAYHAAERSSINDSGVTFRKFQRLLREEARCNGKVFSVKMGSNTNRIRK